MVLVLLLWNYIGHYFTKKYVFLFCVSFEIVYLPYRGRMSAVDITAKSNDAYGLIKISDLEEATYM